ncbi:MAG: amidohydrolase family protein, partial [Actinobacteria bacterium]|nr:amidohydrolase family protein [Actinomycetota bacterium]
MPTADAHIHLFAGGFAGPLGPAPEGCDELAHYERLRHHYGIERALVIGYEGEPRYRSNNDHLLALARYRPWVVPLAYLTVSRPPTVEHIRSLCRRGAAGFSLYLPRETDARALCSWPAATLGELNAQRALLSLNAPPAALAEIATPLAALERCPTLISHLGLPGRFARPPSLRLARSRLAPLTSVSRMAHVAVKLSGLYGCCEPAHDFPHASAQPLVDVVLDTFGPARLLWGSDFLPALDFVSFAQLADTRPLAGCSSSEADAVMGGNLLRLLESRPSG